MKTSEQKSTSPSALQALGGDTLSPAFYKAFEAVQVLDSSVPGEQPVLATSLEPVQTKWAEYLDVCEWDPEEALQLLREAQAINLELGGERLTDLESAEMIELVRLRCYDEARQVAIRSLNQPGWESLPAPKQRQLLNNVAFIAMESADYPEADRLYECSDKVSPNSVLTLSNWAVIKMRRGQSGAALERVQRILALIQQSPEKRIQWINKTEKYPELLSLLEEKI